MNALRMALMGGLLLGILQGYTQAIKLDKNGLIPNRVSMSLERLMGKEALRGYLGFYDTNGRRADVRAAQRH